MDCVCSVIIPMYNEESVIHEAYTRIKEVMDSLEIEYELIFINDGSRDSSVSIVKKLAAGDLRIKLIDLSRNFGHQAAVSAGMDYAKGQAVVIIDADLQDPPEVIPRMLDKWKEGYDVVYGKRSKRQGESSFKRVSAFLFYRFLRLLIDEDIPNDTGDFRLIDSRICKIVAGLKEKNRFIRGMISWVGFRQTSVEYVRDQRFAGDTKYPLRKMIKFALDGITSFSYKPLKLASYLGFIFSLSGFVYLCIVLYQRLFSDKAVAGWASTIAVNLVFNGVTLVILGIIGEYIGRIFEEVKDRPLYIIKEVTGFDKDKDSSTD